VAQFGKNRVVAVLTVEEEGGGVLIEPRPRTNDIVGVLEWKGKATRGRERRRALEVALYQRREGKWRGEALCAAI
jgi:hypothetical protein